MTQAARATATRARSAGSARPPALGLAFLWAEIAEYRHLWTAAEPVRLGGDLYAGHVLRAHRLPRPARRGGGHRLLAVAVRGARPRTLEVVALYWHFVDLAWMPIFTFLYLMPAR